MTTPARLCPRTLRAQYVREMRDMAALVLDLRALRQDVRADGMTRARDRRGAELRALIARADQGADR